MNKFREYKSCSCQHCHNGSRKRHKRHAHKQFRHAVKHTLQQSGVHGMSYLDWGTADWECGKVATKPMWD